jgi:glycosyltransferase involved in cell wall biosynthesis
MEMNGLRPFISVVIPTHNRLAMLRQTLDCLANQTYPADRYEVIVVDNGSKDETEGYLEHLSDQGRLHHIRQQPLGPAAAENVGTKAARGEVVAFTNDDCLPEAGWLAALAESYTSNESSSPIVAVGGAIKNSTQGHWLRPFYAVQGNRHRANDAEQPEYLDTANASFRCSVLLHIGGFDEAFPVPAAEDVDLGLRLTAAGYELHTNADAVVWHVGRPSPRGMMLQSFGRGRGGAYLRMKYPERYASPPSRGTRSRVRRLLNQLVRRMESSPRPIRPFACGLMAALRCGAFSLVEVFRYFVPVYLREQRVRYESLGLSRRRRLLYLALEWCDYLTQLIGRIVGTFSYARREVQAGREVS